MNRRGFLKLFASAAIATQIPAPLLNAAEKKTGDYCVRYIRVFDIYRGQMIQRVDVARGIDLPVPHWIETAGKINNVSQSYLSRAIKMMKGANVDPRAIAALEERYGDLKPGDIIGVHYSIA